MKVLLRLMCIFCAFTVISTNHLVASHAQGADLTYTCLGGNQYRFRFSFYRDCTGITPSTSISINLTSASCGQNTFVTLNLLAGYPIEVSPLCASQLPNSTCNGGTLPGVQQYIYEGTFTLPAACNDWVFSFTECCRNSGITSLSIPGSENLYVQATLDNLTAPCNSSPEFTSLPVPFICAGQSYIYNHGAVDADGDSLVYSLIDAQNASGSSVAYNAGFGGTNPLTSSPAVSIDPTNGNVTMNPTVPQVGVIAVLVQEYRNGVLIGSTIRDIQVTVLNCTNNPPTINALTGVTGATQTGPYSIELCPGQTLNFTIPGLDIDAGQNITWSWNNGIPGGIFTGPSGPSPQSATFSWTPTAADVGLHSLTVSLVDNGCPVIGSQIRAINILVLQGTTAGPDQFYCVSGGPAQLSALGGTVFNWNILSGTPGSLSCTNCQSPSATPTVPTVYEVVSNLPGPCKNRDTVLVTPVPSFSLTMPPNPTICTGGSTTLGATPSPAGVYTYAWSPGTNLSSTTVANPTANPTASTTYTVTVTSAAGCRMTGSQTVTVSNAVLAVAPTVNPVQSCQGTPVTLSANASSGDCNQYTVASIPHAPIGAGGWTNLSLTDDQLSAAIPLGFNFTYFCNTYSNVHISSNAFISFDPLAGAGCCSGQNIPSVNVPNNAIFVHHEDYGPNTPRYKTVGAAPNRRFIVHYNGATHLSGSGTALDAQVILYETSNNIEIHITNAGTDGTGETEGIENSTGTIAYTIPGRNATPWSVTNDAYRFSPVPPTPFTVTWQSPLGTNVGTGSTLNVTPPSTTTYYAIADNGICSASAPVQVQVAAANAGPDQYICPVGSGTSLAGSYSGPPAPNNCNIYSVSSIPFAPQAAGGTSLSLGDDQVSTALPIGFTFNFFCTNYTNVYASSNGFITFNAASGSGCCSGSVMPTTFLSDFIAGAWNDLYPPGGGTIQYQTTGTTPNRRFVITYTNVNHCCGTGTTNPINTFQIQLHETTNNIEIHSTTITDDGSTITQGIQGGTTNFLASPGRNGVNFTATNDAYRFVPQVNTVTYSWTPATNLSSTTVPNPTISSVTSPTTYILTVNNGVCIMTDTVFVDVCLPFDQLELRGVAEGNQVKLNWDAFNEINLEKYVIERSIDQQYWSDLGEKTAIGQPNSAQAYGSYDRQPNFGSNFYRLRAIGQDGSFAHSNTVEVVFDKAETVFVQPNPSTDIFNFEIGTIESGDLEIEIFNAAGQIVQVLRKSDAPAGINRLRADLGQMPSGIYLYRVRTNVQELSGRVLKID